MKAEYIFTIEQFLSPEECASFLETIEAEGFQDQYSGMGQLIRSRAVFENDYWATLIWDRLKSVAPQLTDIYNTNFVAIPTPKQPLETYHAVKVNERFRCYKYGVGEEFTKHEDFAFEYSETMRTFLTVLIYLNDAYTGGETEFDNYKVNPSLGMLAMFPHELPHRGCKIKSGLKYALRTDVVYASN